MSIKASNIKGFNRNTKGSKKKSVLNSGVRPTQKGMSKSIQRGKSQKPSIFNTIFGKMDQRQKSIMIVVALTAVVVLAGILKLSIKDKDTGIVTGVVTKNNVAADPKKAQVDYIVAVKDKDGKEKKYLLGSKTGTGQNAYTSTRAKDIKSVDPKVEKSTKKVDLKQFINDFEDGYTKVDIRYKKTSASAEAGVDGQIYGVTYYSNVDELAVERQKKQNLKDSLTIRMTTTEAKVDDKTYVITYKYFTPANSGDEVYGISLKEGQVSVDGFIKKGNEYYSMFSNEKIEKSALNKYITTVDFNNKPDGSFKLNYGTKENADAMSNIVMQQLQNAVMSAKQRQEQYLTIDSSKSNLLEFSEMLKK